MNSPSEASWLGTRGREGLLGLIALGWGLGFAAANPANPLPVLEWFEPAPALIEQAEKLGVATSGLVTASEQDGVPPDSEVVALIVHGDEKRTRQWLVRLVAREPSPKERKLKPEQQRFYTNTGSAIEFAGTKTPIAIQVLGPVTVGPTPQRQGTVKAVWSGALVPAEHLSLGLDRASVVNWRLAEYGGRLQRPLGLSWSNRPFADEVVVATRAQLEGFELTEEDERTLVGSTPALMQFFTIAAQTPEVRDVLRDLLDLNVWALVLKGRMPRIGLHLLSSRDVIDLESWGFGQTTVRGFPFVLELDERPRLVCSMAVVAPRPPYVTSAGIVAMAVKPVDDDRSRLVLRLIASRLPTNPVPAHAAAP